MSYTYRNVYFNGYFNSYTLFVSLMPFKWSSHFVDIVKITNKQVKSLSKECQTAR